MLSLAEVRVLADFKRALASCFGARLAGLVLFGSRARGEGNERSDLDVLVFVRGLARPERRAVIDLAFDLELASGLSISPLVRDPSGPSVSPALAEEIARDGANL